MDRSDASSRFSRDGPPGFITSDFVNKPKLNSVVLVRKRTIPTERPQPVGEVSAK
jgi:hypothetical protein